MKLGFPKQLQANSREQSCCPTGARGLFARKLGRCPLCMWWSAVGAVSGWAIWYVAYTFSFQSAFTSIFLVCASLFSMLWLAHMIAFVRAHIRLRKAEVRVFTSVAPELDRTAFLLTIGKAMLASLAFTMAGGSAYGQRKRCVLGEIRSPVGFTKVCTEDEGCPRLFDSTGVEWTHECIPAREVTPRGNAFGPLQCFCVYYGPLRCGIERDAHTDLIRCLDTENQGKVCREYLFTAASDPRRPVDMECLRVETVGDLAGRPHFETKCICTFRIL